jgi:RNA polymerase sigma factor for flagellar operon FliA
MGSLQHDFDFSLIEESNRQQELENQITAHLPLVRKLAQQILSKLPKGVTELDDLMSAGMYGLLEAVKRYEPHRKNLFETFAYMRIRGAMLDSLRADDPGSRTLRQKAKAVEQAKDQLTKSLGRLPSSPEIVDALGITLPEYRSLVGEIWSLRIVSLNSCEPSSEKSQTTLIDRIPDRSAVSPLALLEKKETSAHLLRAIESLPEREKRVVSLYYDREMTMKEIGAELGVMESYVSKIHAKAILKMKSTMMDGGVPISSDRRSAKHLLMNRGAERKALKPSRAEQNAYRPIAAMQLAKVL